MICQVGGCLVALQWEFGGKAALGVSGRSTDCNIDRGADVFHECGLRQERLTNSGPNKPYCRKKLARSCYALLLRADLIILFPAHNHLILHNFYSGR